MKNIHVLPTDKPSRIVKGETTSRLLLHNIYGTSTDRNETQNIYITSDEPAYPYALHITNQKVLKVRAVGSKSLELYHDKGFSYPEECKKIILTTDQDLIKDGVQAIDDEFLEWFVKNSSCEEAEVEREKIVLGKVNGTTYTDFKYKIIIPKEEPKQETLEEAAERLATASPKIFKEGAKWQQKRSYSEQDMRKAFYEGHNVCRCVTDNSDEAMECFEEWFEQFKKK